MSLQDSLVLAPILKRESTDVEWLVKRAHSVALILDMEYPPTFSSRQIADQLLDFRGGNSSPELLSNNRPGLVDRSHGRICSMRKGDIEKLGQALGLHYVRGTKSQLALRLADHLIECAFRRACSAAARGPKAATTISTSSKSLTKQPYWHSDLGLQAVVRELNLEELISRIDFRTTFSPEYIPEGRPIDDPRFLYSRSMQGLNKAINLRFSFLTPPTSNSNSFSTRVHLKCWKVEKKYATSGKLSSFVPSNWLFIVNGRYIALPQRFEKSWKNDQDFFLDVTPYLFPSTSRKQNLFEVLSKRPCFVPSSSISIVFLQQMREKSLQCLIAEVRKSSHDLLLAQRGLHRALESSATRCPETSTTDFELDMRKSLCAFSSESVQVSSIRLPLRCPLSLQRIQVPSRGNDCKHLQCFDLESFLNYRKTSGRLECPVCNRKISDISQLTVPPLYEFLLNKYQEADDVDFLPSGKLEVVRSSQRKSATGNSSTVTAIDVDTVGMSITARSPVSKSAPSASRVTGAVVDLTNENDSDNDVVEICGVRSTRGTRQSISREAERPSVAGMRRPRLSSPENMLREYYDKFKRRRLVATSSSAALNAARRTEVSTVQLIDDEDPVDDHRTCQRSDSIPDSESGNVCS